MKKLIRILPLTLISLIWTTPSFAKDIKISFPKGSSCGSYHGMVNIGDTFVLSLAKEQQLVIKKSTGHDYSVIAPNGKVLEVINRYPNQENQYWTGNQAGNFKVRINSVPDGLQLRIEFCAYTGEGDL